MGLGDREPALDLEELPILRKARKAKDLHVAWKTDFRALDLPGLLNNTRKSNCYLVSGSDRERLAPDGAWNGGGEGLGLEQRAGETKLHRALHPTASGSLPKQTPGCSRVWMPRWGNLELSQVGVGGCQETSGQESAAAPLVSASFGEAREASR